MNKTLMAAGLAVILGACSSSKKSDVAEGATPNPFFAEEQAPKITAKPAAISVLFMPLLY